MNNPGHPRSPDCEGEQVRAFTSAHSRRKQSPAPGWLLPRLLIFMPAVAAVAADHFSGFVSDAEGWTATAANSSLTWAAAGGQPAGHLRGAGNNETWHFVSPADWAGDWRGYRTLKFDLILFDFHYPDLERTNLVVIRGANGGELVWNALSPDPTWTHYELRLDPASFLTDQATFDGVMRDVSELRILGEHTLDAETTGLDNVLLTSAGPAPLAENLMSTFATGIENWRGVDDVDLSHRTEDYLNHTGGMLAAKDQAIGRTYWLASPLSWSGDWSRFRTLLFDFAWLSSYELQNASSVNLRIIGANGWELRTYLPIQDTDEWQRIKVPLDPATFGVTQEWFDAIMSHVVELRWRGEYVAGAESALLDNVILTESLGFPVVGEDLVSDFEAGTEDWRTFGNASLSHETAGGDPGGFLKATDGGGGVYHFVSPESWAGDWRQLRELRFKLKSLSRWAAGPVDTVTILAFDGRQMTFTHETQERTWTPFVVALNPENFGVDRATFDGIMRNVSELRIRGESPAVGPDAAGLDSVRVRLSDAPIYPPERRTVFASDVAGWRAFGGTTVSFQPTGGNPDGFLQGGDEGGDRWGFASPETWNGDWRAYRLLSFDFRIVVGAYGWGQESLVGIHGANGQWASAGVATPPNNSWTTYRIPLTAQQFNLTDAEFEAIMSGVLELVVNAEVVSGGDAEAIDNVILTKEPAGYNDWKPIFWSGPDLEDEDVSGLYADPDGDGVDNVGEFDGGTDPTDANDRLRIDRIILLGDTCRIEWTGHAGHGYTVQGAPDLPVLTGWISAGEMQAGVEGPMSLEIPHPDAARFLRLKAVRFLDD